MMAASWGESDLRQEPRVLARSLFLYQQLAAFLDTCHEAGLCVIVLKGAALAETVYPRLGLRPFGDIDVLVRPDDAALARTLMAGLGYTPDETHWADLLTGRDCQTDFSKQMPGGPVIIELHTDLINNDLFWNQICVDEEGLWQRAQAAHLAGRETRVLGWEDQLVHLCLHLSGHYLSAPRSLRDIQQVCASRQVDWGLLTEISQEARAATCVYTGLWLAVRLLDASVPVTVLTALAPRPFVRRRLLERFSLKRAADLKEEHTERLRLPLLLLLLDNPLVIPRVLARVLFPSRRWLLDHYAEPGQSPPGAVTLYAAHVRYLLRAGFRGLFVRPASPR